MREQRTRLRHWPQFAERYGERREQVPWMTFHSGARENPFAFERESTTLLTPRPMAVNTGESGEVGSRRGARKLPVMKNTVKVGKRCKHFPVGVI
jgi:hypothetical protein